MKRFVAVMNIPSPYRLHSLGEWCRQLNERGYEFHCHFMARGHKDRPKSWLNPQIDFPHTYWWDCGFGQHHFNPGLVLRLMLNPPDVLHLGSPYDTFTCIALAKLCRAKVISVGLEGNTQTPGRMTGALGWFKRWVLKEGDYATVPGVEGTRFVALHQQYTTAHMPKPAVFPNLVDERRFMAVCQDKKDIGRRTCFDVTDERVCLIPARFDPVKGLKEFFGVLTPEMVKGWRLVVMGHGPEEESTLAIVKERGLSPYVKVIHSVPYEEMPQYYAAADMMLLPSLQDMNPLCVVEAIHSGLPLALSDQAGNVEEAVTEGVNGWRLPVLEQDAYREKLKLIFKTSRTRLSEMGQQSKAQNAQFWNTQDSVKRWLDQILVGL